MHNSTGYVIKQLVHALSVRCRVVERSGGLEGARGAGVALGYRLGQLLRFLRALRASRVLRGSMVHAKA